MQSGPDGIYEYHTHLGCAPEAVEENDGSRMTADAVDDQLLRFRRLARRSLSGEFRDPVEIARRRGSGSGGEEEEEERH